MSRLDATLRPLAARLVAGAGTAMTLRRDAPADYDPVTGSVTITGAEQPMIGVIETAEAAHRDGLVQRGDTLITLAAEPLAAGLLAAGPEPGDAVLIGGVEYRVIAVTTLWAGDRPALFRLHARR